MLTDKKRKYYQRKKRSRAKIQGTAARPRLSVFRSGRHIYAQLIDDEKGRVMAAASDREIKKKKQTGQEKALETGRLIAEKAKALKIEKVVFCKGAYKYHGRVKSLAEGARQAGLVF